MKANIRTISEMTGFSTATVSNALNNKRGVNRETSEKILKAAREIGYLDSPGICQVKLVTYIDNGSIVNESPFFSMLMAGVEAECRQLNIDTVSYHIQRTDPNYSNYLSELLNEQNSALLILATELDGREAARLKEAASPIVILDNWYEDQPFDAVLIDNADAAYRAVSHLIEMGHTRIGHLRGKFEIKNFYYRRQGYLRAMSEHGIKAEPKFTMPLSTGMESSCADMAALLEKGPELPTAFFADNDMIALGAMRALQQAGYQVPRDVSIVGFDDLPFCSISSPPLTTVKVHNYQMGRAAVRRLMEIVDNGAEYCSKIQIRSSFVQRESVRNLKDVEGRVKPDKYQI